MDVWLNGAFVPRDDARISVFDAGFQHAVGIFETLLARHGRVFRAEAHAERLLASCKELQLTERLRMDPLVEALERTVTHNELDRARLRLSITGGDLNLLQSRAETTHDPTILIVAQPPTAYPPELFEHGVRVAIADGRENPLAPNAGHKTIDYWTRIRALQDAGRKGASEALWFTVSNHVAGGSVSNVFLVKDEKIITPFARGEEAQGALAAPVRPGVTREVITQIAAGEGIVVERAMLNIEALLAADEVFLTNSSWGVLPVVAVERETIGAGTPGAITQRMHAELERVIEEETDV